MKKLLCFILSLIVVFSVTSSAFAVVDNPEVEIDGEITDYPVVMVPGYSGCWLCLGDDPETATCAWSGVNIDELGPNLLNRIAEIGIGLGAMTLGNADYIAKIIGEEFRHTWPMMACKPDGTSEYDIHPYYTTPDKTNSEWLSDTDNDFCRHDRENASCFDDYVGKENIFNFNIDWRMGVEDCANQLNDYIKAVKEYTGKDKVNIHAISQGGQIAATYLALYCEEEDVDNAVLSSPAIGGSGLASDLLLRKVDADEQTIVEMIEHVLYVEENYEWLLRANELGFLDDILNALVPQIADFMGYWPSIWDFVPVSEYEECKAAYLTSEENAPLIESSDRFHYEILPMMGEKLRWCNEHGMNVSIITGTGTRMVSGMPVTSDAIIPVSAATGATCAPYGERFCDGYVQANDCGGNYKISPDMTIDASTCYLPDNTWFSEGNFHAWTYFSDVTKKLNVELLLTDTITSVYDDPDYPQFLRSDNESKSIVYSFNNSVDGYITGDSDALVIRNVMNDSKVKIKAIYADGLDLSFDTGLLGVSVEPGESASISFSGNIPETSGKCVRVTVCYSMGNITPLNYRTLGFTVMNGEYRAASNETVASDGGTPLDRLLGNTFVSFLQKLGLREIFTVFFTILWCRVSSLFNV